MTCVSVQPISFNLVYHFRAGEPQSGECIIILYYIRQKIFLENRSFSLYYCCCNNSLNHLYFHKTFNRLVALIVNRVSKNLFFQFGKFGILWDSWDSYILFVLNLKQFGSLFNLNFLKRLTKLTKLLVKQKTYLVK